ncbi:hypothetical protein FACS189427_00860 [Planctomycetales bacterium]|nr:hypothetical protein FACS189427_00860 [Planctomycetales bacterium]
MIYPQPENTDTITATEEMEFHPAEEVRILRQELAERLAMLTEKYGTEKNPAGEIAAPIQQTFQEHLEAAAQAVSLLQQNIIQQAAAISTILPTKTLPIKPAAKEPVKAEIVCETAYKTETAAENRLLPVLKGMNSVFVIIGVLGFLWTVLYYLRGDSISQAGIYLAAAGIGLITVGIGGRLIQDYINRPNYSAVH